MNEITLAEFTRELNSDPDLRRLGEYKVVLEGGRPVFPVIFEESGNVHLGNGDFTEAFTALDELKADTLDLGSSVFSDLYLDYLKVDTLKFSDSTASRLYFDYAQINNCEFNNFTVSEIYFDEANIGKVEIQELKSGLIHLDGVQINEVVYSGDLASEYRFDTIPGGTVLFGGLEVSRPDTEATEAEALELTIDEFINELNSNPDLRRLGKYKVISDEKTGTFVIDLDKEGQDIDFGEGDFSYFPFTFEGTKANSISLDNSTFAELSLGESSIGTLDFADSKVGKLNFDSAKINKCYLSRLDGYQLSGDMAQIGILFGEHAKLESVELGEIKVNHFIVNYLETDELNLNQAEINELYMSRGEGVDKMYFDESDVSMMNLHEAKINELHFGKSSVTKALINKSSINEIHCDELHSDLLYIGHHQNELGKVDFGEGKDIDHIEVEEILTANESRKGEGKRIFREFAFGTDEARKNKGGNKHYYDGRNSMK